MVEEDNNWLSIYLFVELMLNRATRSPLSLSPSLFLLTQHKPTLWDAYTDEYKMICIQVPFSIFINSFSIFLFRISDKYTFTKIERVRERERELKTKNKNGECRVSRFNHSNSILQIFCRRHCMCTDYLRMTFSPRLGNGLLIQGMDLWFQFVEIGLPFMLFHFMPLHSIFSYHFAL